MKNKEASISEPAEKMPLTTQAVPGRKQIVRSIRIRLVCFSLILFMILSYGVYVLTPKHIYGVCPMLNLYRQPLNSVDVLVLGTSVAYAGVNTNTLWKEYGLACYNLCSAEIPYWSLYYQFQEALRHSQARTI